MPDGLGVALATPGLVWILGATFVAGLVYGFAGFGSGFVLLPVITIFVPPPVAVAAFAVSALSSLVILVPRAWALADRRATLWMIGAALATAPAGIWIMRHADPLAIRWLVCAVVAVTLAALISGWRYRAAPGPVGRGAVGAATGVVGGATGLTGPVVILFHLAGQGSAAQVRANTLCFLTILSLCLLPQLALQGALVGHAVWLGLVLLVPYALGTRTGRTLFRPGAEAVYRHVAYGVIALAVLTGLPVWG